MSIRQNKSLVLQICFWVCVMFISMLITSCASANSKWVQSYGESHSMLRHIAIDHYASVSEGSELVLSGLNGERLDKWRGVINSSMFVESNSVCSYLYENHSFFEQAGVVDFELYKLISDYNCSEYSGVPLGIDWERLVFQKNGKTILIDKEIDTAIIAVSRSFVVWLSQALIGVRFLALKYDDNHITVDQLREDLYPVCANVLFCIWALDRGEQVVPKGISKKSFWELLVVRRQILGMFRLEGVAADDLVAFLKHPILQGYGINNFSEIRRSFFKYIESELKNIGHPSKVNGQHTISHQTP